MKSNSEPGRDKIKRRYAYALEFRNVDGNWMLSVDWPCYGSLKAAEARVAASKPDMRYRIRKMEFAALGRRGGLT